MCGEKKTTKKGGGIVKFNAMVQDTRDASYDGKKGHVEAVQINVIEIGADSFAGVLGVKVPKGGEVLAPGSQVEVVIRSIRGTFSGVTMCDGTVKPLLKVVNK